MGMYVGHFDFEHSLPWTVPELFSATECAALVAEAADHTWMPATVNSAAGRVVEPGVRDSTTAVLFQHMLLHAESASPGARTVLVEGNPSDAEAK